MPCLEVSIIVLFTKHFYMEEIVSNFKVLSHTFPGDVAN